MQSIYSFVGNFSPAQDTDCANQPRIKNIHDPAEIYRQALQNALVASEKKDEDTLLKVDRTHVRPLVYRAPAIHLRSTLSGSSDPLLIIGSFRPQADTRQLILRMTLFNATQVDLENIA